MRFRQCPFQEARQIRARHANPGPPGRGERPSAELKLIADVGLIGLPNPAESTFLARISSARTEDRRLSFYDAQFPSSAWCRITRAVISGRGIYPDSSEGAHEGAGLGSAFLGHAERPAWSAPYDGIPIGDRTRLPDRSEANSNPTAWDW